VRISTVISGHKVLENFVQSVMRSKREKIKAITVFDVEEVTGFSPSRLEWRRRAIPSRSMETIDLDQGMKNEMIQNEMIQKFESFADPNRAGWYIERGVPYYCDYQFHGPPGTGN
jgi:5'-3' exonuclease